ncbi:MAG: glycoside hydrolase family 3 C-terminal domain-containing protein [Clostridia bacterium]|nr:glycoside hydrolase family 3 C-terminal domain-containing protein [Clostridia bacterium]
MERFGRYLYQPVLPLGKDGRKVTASKKHLELTRRIATEGTVLLKNDGTLPLAKGSRICLFGRGVGEYIFGGGGSGSLMARGRIDPAAALLNRKDARVFRPLVDFYRDALADGKDWAEGLSPQETSRSVQVKPRHTPALPDSLYREAVAFGGTAILILARYSTEEMDRSGGAGDYTLLPEEEKLLEDLCRDFEKVVVVFNVCGVMDVAPFAENGKVNAVLYTPFAGHLAGESLADILLGDACPGGRLQDTLARSLDDYPTTATFRESEDYVNYEEDIFVGYRYFETFCPEKVVYPFGFGLSYTAFSRKTLSAQKEKNTVSVSVLVKNTGKRPGRDVAQLYLTAPQGKLGKAKKVLAAFEKTRELAPGQEQTLRLSFDIRSLASFDDLGLIRKSAFVLEKGEYQVLLGENVRDTEKILSFRLEKNEIVKVCTPYLAPVELPRRLRADGSYETLPGEAPLPHPVKRHALRQPKPETPISLAAALKDKRLDGYLRQFSDDELADTLFGHTPLNASYTGCLGHLALRGDKRKPGYIPTADGPAGYRATYGRDVYTTHFPCANMLAQTWDPALARRFGRTVALEIKENNAGIWLAPALNIHRSPLCGRNFEYFSEDPLSSGVFAAAVVKGVQGEHVVATVKHFLCNNKETNRKESDSRVSQRALREIYLKGFEICIKKSRPGALMTSYNRVNGVRASANWELINGVLRGEWRFTGVVMTDWEVYSTLAEEVRAGSDVKMPKQVLSNKWGTPAREEPSVGDQVRMGLIDRGAMIASAYRVYSMMDLLE